MEMETVAGMTTTPCADETARPWRARTSAPTVILCAALIALSYIVFHAGIFADFRAGWMAGKAFAAGEFDLVYPPHTGVYEMRPPAEWIDRLTASGYKGPVYPFVYPPLWAWVAAQFTSITSFDVVARIATFLNPAMLIGSLLVAHSLAAPRMNQALYLISGFVFLTFSMIGTIALYENQPQILVAFLTVLAVERAERGHFRVAGTALAFAASLKLFPAFIAILWLAAGRRQAATVFLVIGAALAALSVVLAGWPLHRTFLAVLGDVSATTLVTKLTYSLESTAAHLVYRDELRLIAQPLAGASGEAKTGWYFLAEPRLFHAISNAVQAAALGALILGFRMLARRRGGRALPAAIWPFALMLIALTGPLAWAYYYIAPLVFLPMLIDRIGAFRGIVVISISAALLSPFLLAWIPLGDLALTDHFYIVQTLGTLIMAALAALFLRIALRMPAQDPTDRP
ncbi:MAG: glycosyltransferase family 87 protein [Paracoccaceae bacterium]